MRRPLQLLTGLMLLAAIFSQPARSGEWPERPVRIFIPFPPGISVDVAGRAIAESLSKRWKQTVVIENRPGADTMLGTKAFVESSDGHTLLFTTHSTFTVVPLLRAKVPYDPVNDARPISLAVEDFLTVAVAPALGVSSLSQLVEIARHQPAKLNFYAVPGAPYLAYLAFQKQANINTPFVPYTNPVNAISDLSEGRIQVAVLPLASALGAAEAGKIKLIAVTNAIRSPAAPDVPTVAEAGYPEFTFGGFLGLFGPKDIPLHVQERVASEVHAALSEESTQKLLTKVGLIPRGTTPAEFRAIIDTQRAKWSAIAHEHHVEPQ